MALSIFALTTAADEPQFDYSREKVLHVVGTAHLDTQWRWTIQNTINEYIKNTLDDNFALFEKYPHYKFSFEGAFRYMLMKEYYPADYERLKKYIEEGRWHLTGSSIDAGDVNLPSAEGLIRNILYGQQYFMKEFGKVSRDIFLPDCFGFGYQLPTIEVHCGLTGFSTQKLTWGSAYGTPFDIGAWQGVDGSKIVAEINPDPYVDRVTGDLSKSERWIKTIEKQGEESGLFVGYKYFGTGDVGGAPTDDSVAWVEKSMTSDGPLKVISVPADQLANELYPDKLFTLPQYDGELLMTTHGTGCYTSQNAMKRWNRKNELLADSAEKASVLATWLGGISYPQEKLNTAWIRFIWHQFHDDLTGTSIPEAYEFSWNDELLSLNQFSSILDNSAGAVSRALDTMAEGEPVVVYNPLAFNRNDVVEAKVNFEGGAPKYVRVFAPDGSEVPAQINDVKNGEVTIAFMADMPPVGFAVYDVRPSESAGTSSELSVSRNKLENETYRVTIDDNGDVSSIFDKKNGKEMLQSPIRLALFDNYSPVWPAWEVTYDVVQSDPVDYVTGVTEVKVLEDGPARVALAITRKHGKSTYMQTLSLTPGAEMVRFDNTIDWREKERLLKAVFELTNSDTEATYDLGVGVIRRGNNTEQLYEVPAQQWANITNSDFTYSVTVMNDCLYGWDKPADNTLRLTMLHTPKPRSYPDQAMQDIGRHKMAFGITGHDHCWRYHRDYKKAARFNQPLIAFNTGKHPGMNGKTISFMNVSSDLLKVSALKKAENSDEIVVRVFEAVGKQLDGAEIGFPLPVISARELNGAEEPMGEATVKNGKLVFSLKPYQPKAFAVTLAQPDQILSKPQFGNFELPYNVDVISGDGNWADGDMDGSGKSYSADLVPDFVTAEDIQFKMGPTENGAMNAVACKGQTITIPAGPQRGGYTKIYILAAANGGDTTGTFKVGDQETDITVQDFTGFIGQWDNRLVGGTQVKNVFQVTPGYVKTDDVAWVGTHRHDAKLGNEAYRFTYLFKYTLDVPRRARTITLPDNENIKVFAISASLNLNDCIDASLPLYDRLESTSVRLDPVTNGRFVDTIEVGLVAQPANAVIHYTLDGSEPTESSPVFRNSFTISEDTELKAIAFSDDIEDSRLMVADFEKLVPQKASKVSGLKNGVSYRICNGRWDSLPPFKKIKTTKRGTMSTLELPEGHRDDDFAVEHSGYIMIPEDGVYTFYTSSDDGSALWINDEMVVDNNGLHGATEENGMVALLKGPHKIRVGYFERSGNAEVLNVYWMGNGFQKRPIEADVLKHK